VIGARRDGHLHAAAAALDDGDALARLDSEDVLGAVERFAEQCLEGWDVGRAATALPDATDVDSVVVLGMGGSGVSGDVVASVVEPRLPVPLRTIKGYGPLPEWVGRNTLVFAVSYSGSTEETLAALEDARERGARVVTVSSGGPLADAAQLNGFAQVRIPAGLQPRASLGYLTMPILAVLERVELIPPLDEDVDEAAAVLGRLAEEVGRDAPTATNPAKLLSARLHERVPIVYGAEGLTATAAYRFKCDLNEYAKTPAYWHFFPELDHNEIVGWNRLSDLTSQRFVAVLLRDSIEHERIALRVDITRRLIDARVADVVTLRAQGRAPLARLLSLVFVTQMAAIYLGVLYGVDPGPVEVIQALKSQLAQHKE
jgi:glucose/mannose-6-phosphate isomerase